MAEPITAAFLDGPARILRPMGDRTVRSPVAGMRRTVVEVELVDVVAVEVVVMGAEAGGVL